MTTTHTGPLCPQCQAPNPWGIEIRGAYDGVIAWECAHCHHAWPRFHPADHPGRAAAARTWITNHTTER